MNSSALVYMYKKKSNNQYGKNETTTKEGEGSERLPFHRFISDCSFFFHFQKKIFSLFFFFYFVGVPSS